MGDDSHHIEELEKRRAAEIARAHAAIADAQDRSYWLDRWHVDLNALMRRRGASELRAATRAARALYRALYNASDRMRRGARTVPRRAEQAARAIRDEHAAAAAVGAPKGSGPSARLNASPVTDRLTGRIDDDDPHQLVALRRADGLIDALGRAGGEPVDGQRWLGVGPGADAVLGLVGQAYPKLECQVDTMNGAVDVAFALSAWGTAGSLARVSELRSCVSPGGRLLLSGDARAAAEPLTAERVLADYTPAWRVTLYVPGGMEGGRDLYVLERT